MIPGSGTTKVRKEARLHIECVYAHWFVEEDPFSLRDYEVMSY